MSATDDAIRDALARQAEVKASEAASVHVQSRIQQAREQYDAALRDLTAARDAFDAIHAEAATGRTSAAELAQQLSAATQQQEQAEVALASLGDVADQVEAVESDPVAWFRELQERLPRMAH